jgi:hypothetical protein
MFVQYIVLRYECIYTLMYEYVSKVHAVLATVHRST